MIALPRAFALAATLAFASLAAAAPKPAPTRLASVSPVTTEIALALGAESALVGVDQMSVLPPRSAKLARVGYQRTLAAEGVLSLSPTIVIGTEDAGPPTTLQALREAGVRVEILPAAPSVDAARERIRREGDLLGVASKAKDLVAAMDRDLARADQRRAALKQHARGMFIYTRGNTTALVSGDATPADAVLALAGAENSVHGFQGYRTLGAEAIVAANPDFLLLPKSAEQSLGGIDAILAIPGVSLTPAGRERRVVVMDDDLLLHFGPRLGKAVNDLMDRVQTPAPLKAK